MLCYLKGPLTFDCSRTTKRPYQKATSRGSQETHKYRGGAQPPVLPDSGKLVALDMCMLFRTL